MTVLSSPHSTAIIITVIVITGKTAPFKPHPSLENSVSLV
jgi:hypothetical protein